MRITFLSIFLGLIFTTAGMGQQNAMEIAPDELFDFWIGEWDVHWDEGNGGEGRGTNSIRKILDGAVIQEHFEVLEGNQAGFKGTSISVYQPQQQRWKQAWADNSGGYIEFTGRKEGEKRIFETGMQRFEDGREVIRRMVFYDITEDSLTWDWEVSKDGGESWSLNWRIYYERRK